jgi:hypothetical protein
MTGEWRGEPDGGDRDQREEQMTQTCRHDFPFAEGEAGSVAYRTALARKSFSEVLAAWTASR